MSKLSSPLHNQSTQPDPISFPKLCDGQSVRISVIEADHAQGIKRECIRTMIHFEPLKYEISRDRWRGAVLSDLPDEELFPRAAIISALIETSGFYTPAINRQNYPTAARFLLGRHLRDYNFLFENSLQSGDTGAFIGAPPINRNYNGKEYAYDNLALGAALLDGYSSKLQFAQIKCEPISKKHDVMPEASWVFRLYYREQYFARIGMNLHREGGDIVASITNIQGQNRKAIREMKSDCELWSVYCLADLIKNLPPEITVFRGIPAAHHHSARRDDLSPEERKARLGTMSKLYDPTFLTLSFTPIHIEGGYNRWKKRNQAIIPNNTCVEPQDSPQLATPPIHHPENHTDATPVYYELRRGSKP